MPGGLQSTGWQRDGHVLTTEHNSILTHTAYHHCNHHIHTQLPFFYPQNIIFGAASFISANIGEAEPCFTCFMVTFTFLQIFIFPGVHPCGSFACLLTSFLMYPLLIHFQILCQKSKHSPYILFFPFHSQSNLNSWDGLAANPHMPSTTNGNNQRF